MTNTTKILEISLTIFAFFTFLFFVYYTQVRESIYESQIEETTENNEEDNFNNDIDNQ